MYFSMLVDEWDLNVTIGRFFDWGRLESTEAEEGLTLLELFIETAVESDFFPESMKLDGVARDLGLSEEEATNRLQALISECWRSADELKQQCVYDKYLPATGYLPKVDMMLAIVLMTALIDTAQLATEDMVLEFVRDWLQRKVEPLQTFCMDDVHVAVFIMDYFIDDLRSEIMSFKNYRKIYGGEVITPMMLDAFFRRCAWFPELERKVFRTALPTMSPVQVLYQLRAELRLDFKRKCLTFGIDD